MTRTPARTRRRRLTGLTASLLSLLMLAVPAASWADGGRGRHGGGWEDTGPHGGHSTHGVTPPPKHHNPVKCGQTIGKQPGALYHWAHGHWVHTWEANYPNCIPGDTGPDFGPTGNVKLCPTGFEVYRFYGWKGKAPVAITRSRLNLPAWCDAQRFYTFAGISAWDAAPGTLPGTPDFIRDKDNADQARNHLPAMVGHRENGYLTAGQPTIVTGSCKTVSRPNPLENWYGNASGAERVSFQAVMGDLWWKKSRHGQFPRSAAEELGFRVIKKGFRYTWNSANLPQKTPTKNHHGNHYFLTKFVWDHRPCATPFNFTTSKDAVTQKRIGKKPLVGSCYIPVMRHATQMKSNSATSWGFETLDKGFGERYSNYYAAQNGGDNPGDKVPASWRKAMSTDYMKRSHTAVNKFYNAAGEQILPANEYPAEKDARVMGRRAPVSAKVAAAQLAKWAKCRFATEVDWSAPGPPPAHLKASLALISHNQRVLQAGGSGFQSTFTVTADPLRCNGGAPCGGRARLEKLSYDMELVGTAGYTKCDPGQLSGCDYRIISYTPGTKDRAGRVVAEFYHATAPSQKVRFVVKNVKAAYSYTIHATGFEMTGYDPVTGDPYHIGAHTRTHSKTKPLTPTLTGDPTPQPGRGDGPFVVKYPVISAVDVPLY